jgi:putative glutamine amidotransferase
MNQPPPIIGITTYHRNELGDFHLPGTYIEAVQRANGIPVLLPPTSGDLLPLLDRLDGLIFSGGGDIDPNFYNSVGHPSIYLVDAERDRFELALAIAALTVDIPILGICRGMQVLNVATGGDLFPHVPDYYGDRLLHRLDHPRRPIEHAVQLEPNSRLSTLVGASNIQVVSWHHQAVQTIAPVWQVVARAADGLIEAMEHQHHPWMIAVQWHPELSPDDPVHQRLFQALVSAAMAKGRR